MAVPVEPRPLPAPGELLFVAPPAQRHSRLTAFFRWLLVIPHQVVWVLYGLVAMVAVVLAWFALLVTAKYPAPLYGFVRGFVRYHTRFLAYFVLLSDRFPPFGGGDHTRYPVELEIGPRKASYSRLWVLLRFLPLIVYSIINSILQWFMFLFVFVGWFAVIVLGRMPVGLHKAIAFCVSFSTRGAAYSSLLVERFPSFESSGAGPAAPPAASSPAAT